MSLSTVGIMGTLSHTKPAFTKISESLSCLQFNSPYLKAVSLSAGIWLQTDLTPSENISQHMTKC
jgi:hypothetical protein